MYKLLISIAIFISAVCSAEVKISQLPLQSGSSVGSTDSFPFVYVTGDETMRLKISDIPNVPSFQSSLSALYLPLNGGTMTGLINSSAVPSLTLTNNVNSSGTPSNSQASINIIGTAVNISALNMSTYAVNDGIAYQFFTNSSGSKFMYIGANMNPTVPNAAEAEHLTIGSDEFATLTITRAGQVVLHSNFGASAPDIAWETDLNTGIFQVSTHVLGFSTNGTQAGSIGTSQNWTLGATNGTSTQLINGILQAKYGGTQYLLSDSSGDFTLGANSGSSINAVGDALFLNSGGASAQTVFIATGATDGSMSLGGDNTTPSNSGAGIVFYGSTRATKANTTEFYNSNTLSGSISSSGSWTIGETSSNQHVLHTLTAASSNCGSLSGASACIEVTINGTTHYIPYY